jgi:phosphoribosylanthranilate isomerase
VVKIKCCGMTNLDDCRMAEDLGVDFVGFVFYGKSKRCVTPAEVRRIAARLESGIRTVGVFVEEGDEEIAGILDYCGLHYAQVYRGSTLPRAIRAFRVAGRIDTPFPEEGLLLFDSDTTGFGGSGQSFDLGVLPGDRALLDRSFIAGGMDEHNVHRALRLRPFGVDAVSSLEAEPGKKDRRKMERFVKAARRSSL